GRDPEEFSILHIVEFLYTGWTEKEWSPSTVDIYKCAILAMYDIDNKTFNRHRYTIQFNTMVKRQDLKEVKSTPVGIAPVLPLFRNWGPNESLSLDNLVSRTAWLLGVCGFMRPDDIRCIEVSKSKVEPNGSLSLAVIAPKEKADGSGVKPNVCISPVQDPLICPVQACTAYLARLPQDLSAQRHHKHTRLTPRPDCVPLFRHLHDPSQAIDACTIGSKQQGITLHMRLPPGATAPKCRAIGSTLAAFHGVASDEVKKHGRWSPLSGTFEKFYRLNR
ncbi:hypothetical protein BGX33_010171, partial [Mortierella sp. NVP41]